MEGSSIYGMVLDPMKPSHSEGKGDRRGSIRVVAFSTAPVHRSLKDVLARNVTRAHLRDRQATAPSFLWKCRGCFLLARTRGRSLNHTIGESTFHYLKEPTFKLYALHSDAP